MVLTKFLLKYIFVKLQDIEKETEFGFCARIAYPFFIAYVFPPGYDPLTVDVTLRRQRVVTNRITTSDNSVTVRRARHPVKSSLSFSGRI